MKKVLLITFIVSLFAAGSAFAGSCGGCPVAASYDKSEAKAMKDGSCDKVCAATMAEKASAECTKPCAATMAEKASMECDKAACSTDKTGVKAAKSAACEKACDGTGVKAKSASKAKAEGCCAKTAKPA